VEIITVLVVVAVLVRLVLMARLLAVETGVAELLQAFQEVQ
jgi:hypothetical protein